MANINPSVAAARNAISASINASGYDTPDVWVAVSGGADSLALMAAASFVAKKQGLGFYVVNVNHNLQAGSREVSDTAAKVCADFGIPTENIFIEDVHVDLSNGGLENAARDARYAAIENRGNEISGKGNWVLMTGHTMDDQAETVLLAMSRGSGARALSGIPAQRGNILRPLLGLRRADNEAICDRYSLNVWNDPTNYVTEDGPKRSVLRNTIIPQMIEVLGDGVISGLAKTADLIADDEMELSLQADMWINENIENLGDTYSCDDLAKLPPALLGRVLKRIAEYETSSTDINSKHVAALRKYIINYNGQQGTFLPGGVYAERKNRKLRFVAP